MITITITIMTRPDRKHVRALIEAANGFPQYGILKRSVLFFGYFS